MDLKEEEAIGGNPESHWYYIAKARAIRSLLRNSNAAAMLDVGAGSGVFARMLIDEGAVRSAVCVDPNYRDDHLLPDPTRPIAFKREVGETQVDLVTMLDVIEHVDDDNGLIADYVKKVPPGAEFLISVPAFQFLWSGHDVFLEHRRRYTSNQLAETVRGAGLEVIQTRYFYGVLFPAVAAMRIADRLLNRNAPQTSLKSAPQWLNTALVAVHEVERRLLFPFNRLAGVTCFCLARKP
ncbi:MAG: methyltransferase domain-containing protein [Pseudomonadota bacterium]